jgi:hypothetical protein
MNGFLVYQDRTLSNGNLPDGVTPTCQGGAQPGCLTMQGGSPSGSYTLDGIVYSWGAPAQLSGGSNTTINISLVTGSVQVQGSSALTIGTPSTSNGNQTCGGSSYIPIAWQDF